MVMLKRLNDLCCALATFCLFATGIGTAVAADGSGRPILNSIGSHGRPMSREALVVLALKNSPRVSQRLSAIQIAKAEVAIERGGLHPQIHFTSSANLFRDERLLAPRRPGGADTLQFSDDLLTAGLAFKLPLYKSGELRGRIRASRQELQSAESLKLRVERELVFTISRAFYRILGQEQVIKALRVSEKAMQGHRNIVQDMLLARKAAKVDLLRTEVRLADVKQGLIAEANSQKINYRVLATLVGLPRLAGAISLDGALDVPGSIALSTPDLDVTLKFRNDYQALHAEVLAQEYRLTAARCGHRPQLSLGASYGGQWAGHGSGENAVGMVGLMIDLPLFDGGRISARANKEQSRLEQLEADMTTMSLDIQLQVETARLNAESAFSRISVTKKASEQGAESLRIEEDRYRQGKGRISDVLDAQADQLNAEVGYYRSLVEFRVALLQFYLATGVEK